MLITQWRFKVCVITASPENLLREGNYVSHEVLIAFVWFSYSQVQITSDTILFEFELPVHPPVLSPLLVKVASNTRPG